MIRQGEENPFSDQDNADYNFSAFFKILVSNAPEGFQLVLLWVNPW